MTKFSWNRVNLRKIGEIPTKSIINEVKCNQYARKFTDRCSEMIVDIYLL